MGLRDLGTWLRCNPWAKWLFILAGLGSGYFAGGKLNYRGGKRAAISLGGGGAGWLVSWLLGRTCNGGGWGGDEGLLPEWVPPDEGLEEPHLLGPAQTQLYDPTQFKSPAIRDMATVPGAAPGTSASGAGPGEPRLTTTNQALASRRSPLGAPGTPGATQSPATGAPGGSVGAMGKRRPTRTTTLLSGTRGKAYGS